GRASPLRPARRPRPLRADAVPDGRGRGLRSRRRVDGADLAHRHRPDRHGPPAPAGGRHGGAGAEGPFARMIAPGDNDNDRRELSLGFAEPQATFQSPSQSARVLTEGWVAQQAFCTNCGNNKLSKFANNRPLADFFCSACNEQFELKSKKGAFGAKVLDGAYARKIERLNSNKKAILNLTDPGEAATHPVALG